MSTILIMLRLLDAIVALTGALPQIDALRAKIALFQAEGRDPSPEEWEALFADIDAAGARLDAADRKLSG